MSDEMYDILQDLVVKFNDSDSKKKDKIKDLKRVILISFEDDGDYYTILENGKLTDIKPGKIEADIVLSTTTKTLQRILDKEEDALTAYFSKKIKIKAKLMDKILLGEILR